MDARVVEKIIEVDGRKFSIYKYPAFTSVKVGKMLISKVLPIFQGFVPLITQILGGSAKTADALSAADNQSESDDQTSDTREINFDVLQPSDGAPGATLSPNAGVQGAADTALDNVLKNIGEYLNFESVSNALDRVSNKDLDYIMHVSLMCCYEHLAAGKTQVMNESGRFAVTGLEQDGPFVLRLVVESVIWGLSDFFTANHLKSILNLQSITSQLNRSI